jgi:hypothetical protein
MGDAEYLAAFRFILMPREVSLGGPGHGLSLHPHAYFHESLCGNLAWRLEGLDPPTGDTG